MHGDEVLVTLSFRLDQDDLEQLGTYMAEEGLTMQGALTQLAQDRFGPAGAIVYDAEMERA